jgi:hypothetical protein
LDIKGGLQMAIDKQELGDFSIQGARLQRLNPDGTQPLPSNTLSGVGPFDLSGLTASAGDLTIKIDNGTPETNSVDFAGAVDINAVTPAEAVTALTAASFTDITFSATSDDRVKIAYSGAGTPSKMQVYDELVGYMDIGKSGISGLSVLGTQILKAFTSTVSLARAKNIKAGEEIELEAGDGSLYTVITDDIMKGENPVLNLAKNDFEMKELIQGGSFDATNVVYTPPTTDQTEQPRFSMETFVPEYQKGTNKRSDLVGYLKTTHYSCVGIEGDISNEAKAWAQFAYNLKSTEWTDLTGAKKAAYDETKLTTAEFDALNVEDV